MKKERERGRGRTCVHLLTLIALAFTTNYSLWLLKDVLRVRNRALICLNEVPCPRSVVCQIYMNHYEPTCIKTCSQINKFLNLGISLKHGEHGKATSLLYPAIASATPCLSLHALHTGPSGTPQREKRAIRATRAQLGVADLPYSPARLSCRVRAE